MGHENGGWMNDDQRGYMKHRAEQVAKAAPDLLAALKTLIAEWESIPECDPVPDEINNDSTWEAARAAIAKAEAD